VANREHPIKPKSEDFEQLLLDDRPFVVPRYQRAYDWEEEEVRDWARDLYGLAERRLAGTSRRHFFGAIISVSDDVDKTYEVVDGQQRLTTEILSLSELQDQYYVLGVAAKVAGEKSIAAAANRAAKAVGKTLKTVGGDPRLTLTARDRQYFVDLLDGTAGKPKRGADVSHRKLWNAQVVLRDQLFASFLRGAKSLRERLSRLEAIRGALLEDGYLVHLFTTAADDAHQVFMILNDRGRPLSTGALLRTHTLAVLAPFPAQQSGAEKDWDAILASGDTTVDAFLIAYYVSYTGERELKGELYRSFRTRFLAEEVNSQRAATDLRRVIAQLSDEMEVFAQIRTGVWPYEDSRVSAWERDRLRRLTESLAHRLAHPLLLATARTADEKAFRDLVSLLEPFVFRYINIVGASASALEHQYYDFAEKTRADGALDRNGLRNALKKLLRERAREEQFIFQLREQLRFADNPARKKLIKYFLATLEDYEQWYTTSASGVPKVEDKTRVFDLDTVNIEHIYPQNPRVVDNALENLKNNLGNLTALDPGEGAKAGSEEFLVKRPVYARSNFRITRALATVANWDPDAVGGRFDFYAERAKRIFVVR
jgi:hypothetical protein